MPNPPQYSTVHTMQDSPLFRHYMYGVHTVQPDALAPTHMPRRKSNTDSKLPSPIFPNQGLVIHGTKGILNDDNNTHSTASVLGNFSAPSRPINDLRDTIDPSVRPFRLDAEEVLNADRLILRQLISPLRAIHITPIPLLSAGDAREFGERTLSFLTDRAPRHWYHDSALHGLNQRNRLVYRITPTLNLPAALASQLPLFQVRKLPEMVHYVQVSYLHEPCTYTFHHFSTSLQPLAPMGLPLEKISGVQCVRSEFEYASQLTWGACRPKRKLLHQRCIFSVNQSLKLLVEGCKVWVRLDGML